MNLKLCTLAAVICTASLVVPCIYAASDGNGDDTAAKKHHAAKEKTPPPPSVEDQINALRNEMQTQIDQLKSDLQTKDTELKQAQQQAVDAQAAAAKAQQSADAQAAALTDNTAAVSTLQSSVKDITSNEASLATSISDTATTLKKTVEHPDTLHYKGITITPGGFTAGETVWRAHATGGDIPTAFTSLPYESADEYSLSEFFATARQSRMSLMAQGTTSWGTLRGYFEGDWLGTGVTSNNNQSNSYVFRQRVIWGQAETNNHWAFTGGQLWSLATEDKVGISNLSGDILTPQTIDPNYNAGFVWTRQYGFRVTKTFQHVAFGGAVEQPQLTYTASLAGNTPYAVVGADGTAGGNYNAAVSTCSPSTSIVNYTDQQSVDSSTGAIVNSAVPVYKTVNGCADIATFSFNKAPDVLVKVAIDPGWGHYEIIGIGGFLHETVYPGETTNSNLYGGLKDALTGLVVAPSLTTAGYYNSSINVGGIAGSFRVPVVPGNKVIFGGKALYGPGVGRYGDSTLADVTANANGQLRSIHNFSGLLTLEANPTPRLALYMNYGLDYAARTDYGVASTTTSLGAPSPCFVDPGGTACLNNSGKLTFPSTVTAAELEAGTWGATWAAPSNAAVGYGSRLLSNSGCNTITAPGYNGGGSTGYIPGGSCGAQNRDIQEASGGWWYNIYSGDRGRFRQGFQYSYTSRQGWSGASGIGAKGIDNMFFTSLRYYLP
jgi:TolA-binding protein